MKVILELFQQHRKFGMAAGIVAILAAIFPRYVSIYRYNIEKMVEREGKEVECRLLH